MKYLVGRTLPRKKRRPTQQALDLTDDQARLGHAVDRYATGNSIHEIRMHHNLGNGSRWIRPQRDNND